MLQLQEVQVTLGDFRLNEISLHIRKGKYTVLLGPTGTGKTVLLETIAGMHRVERGAIFLQGKDITRLSPEKRHLGVVYQDYALFPHLTVRKNIAFGLQLGKGRSAETLQRVEEMADFMDIRAILDRRPGNLSGGERQRVALARALVLEPYVLLLDEPLSALDRTTRDRLRRELKRIHREIGVTIVHITHDLSEAFFLADYMAVMQEGSILQEDLTENILRRPADRAVAELLGIENLIPGTVEGDEELLTPLGRVSLPGPIFESVRQHKKILFTIPGWCIEVDPRKQKDQYAWRGNMTVTAINLMEGLVELDLAHTGLERLRTQLSRREIGNMDFSFEVGRELPIGILKEGVYCILD